MGSGVALFDYDGDGDLDVFLVQAGTLDGSPASGAPTSRLSATTSRSRRTAGARCTSPTSPSGPASG
jgi:hypothetical protein